MKKLLFLIVFSGTLFFIAFLVLKFIIYPSELVLENNSASLSAAENPGQAPVAKEEEDSKILLYAVGDIMLDRGVEYKIEKVGNNDFKFPFLKISEDLKKADILFGNLESVISNKGKKVGSVNSFRAQPLAIEGLTYAGFDVVSVANNHVFDYSLEAMEDSFQRLKDAKIDYAGGGFNEEEAVSGKIKEIKNTKIGFLAYCNSALGSRYWKATPEQAGIILAGQKDLEKTKKEIAQLKKNVDILVVSYHWGDEYTQEPNVFQISVGEALVDAGADLVIGHHPHVVQPVTDYKNGWIAYSLGNFIFDMGFSEDTMTGLLLKVVIEEKKIKEVIPEEIKISKDFQPYLLTKDEGVIN